MDYEPVLRPITRLKFVGNARRVTAKLIRGIESPKNQRFTHVMIAQVLLRILCSGGRSIRDNEDDEDCRETHATRVTMHG